MGHLINYAVAPPALGILRFAFIGVLLLVAPVAIAGSQDVALAEETQVDNGSSFLYGDGCIQLSTIDRDSLAEITAPRNSESFGFFCRPEPGVGCDAYQDSVGDLGFLGENGGFCSFVPVGER